MKTEKNNRMSAKAEPRTMIGNIPVYCRFDEIREIGGLVENPENPNKHPQYQIEMLSEVIAWAGWRQPITVSDLSGMIVKGHARLMAAKLAGFTEVPVEIQHYGSPEEERADLIADNRIAELAEMDEVLLKEEILRITNVDPELLKLTGYSENDLNLLLGEELTDIPSCLEVEHEKAGSTEEDFIKFGSKRIIMTADEKERFERFYQSFLVRNGNVFGMMMELLTNGDRNYAD